jgi:hypothetical protein
MFQILILIARILESFIDDDFTCDQGTQNIKIASLWFIAQKAVKKNCQRNII